MGSLFNYYVYRHVRLDTNEVFYIGIGTKLKSFSCFNTEYYRAFSKKSRNAYWRNIANKTEYLVEILIESDDYEIIKEKEKEFIKLYGRKENKGTLSNLTDGGDGCIGIKQSLETIEKRVSKFRGIPKSKEMKEKLSKIHKGKIYNQEIINRFKISVLQYDLEGNFIKEYESLAKAFEETGTTTSQISRVCKNKRKKANGFIWRYKNGNNLMEIPNSAEYIFKCLEEYYSA